MRRENDFGRLSADAWLEQIERRTKAAENRLWRSAVIDTLLTVAAAALIVWALAGWTGA
jgi:type IV secretory pathway component VirB8